MTQQVHLWNGHKAKPGKMGRDIGYSRCSSVEPQNVCLFCTNTKKVVGNTWLWWIDLGLFVDEFGKIYLAIWCNVTNNCKAFLPENKLQGTQSGEFDLSWTCLASFDDKDFNWWKRYPAAASLFQPLNNVTYGNKRYPLRTLNCQCVSFWEKCWARWACWCFQIFHGSMTSWGLSAAYCINIQCQRLLCILLIADMLHQLGQSNSKLLKPCKSWDKLPNPTLLSEI